VESAPRALDQASSTRRPRFFYGWYIVASGFLGNVAYAEQFNASFGVFIYHISEEMGWGRTVLAGVKAVGRLPEAAVAPFLGPLIDRFGARWIMVTGGIIAAIAFMFSATIDQLWELYLFQSILAPIGGVCMGGFVVTIAVSNWFVARRGRAVGLAAMGMSFGTMVLPLVGSLLIEAWGWRGAWFAMGIMILILVVPAGIFVRRRPEDVGLRPDGARPSDAPMTSAQAEEERRRAALLAADVVWTRREVLKTPVLWIMVFSWGFVQFAWASTNLHMVPFFQDLGYPLMMAAGAVSVRSAMAFVGNPIWGLMVERIPIKLAAALLFGSTAVGIGLWLLPPTPPTLIAGLLFFGFGGAGGQVVAEVIWAGYFGRLSLGAVRGVSYPLQSIFAAMGPLAVGLVYDVSGSYRPAFMAMLLGCLLATCLIQLAQPPRKPVAGPTV
jgi:MFS family permease